MFHTILTRLLLFFYLASASLSAAHVHHDGMSHPDCKVCPIVKNIDSADTPSADAIIFLPHYHDREILQYVPTFYYTLTKGFHSQAPPSFS